LSYIQNDTSICDSLTLTYCSSNLSLYVYTFVSFLVTCCLQLCGKFLNSMDNCVQSASVSILISREGNLFNRNKTLLLICCCLFLCLPKNLVCAIKISKNSRLFLSVPKLDKIFFIVLGIHILNDSKQEWHKIAEHLKLQSCCVDWNSSRRLDLNT
jgi:hypothetical protein